MTIKTLIKNYAAEIIISICSILFSTWLMFSTFSYKNGSMLISTKAWSDFANHIPLIRSFAFGNNFPPQDPLFAGPPIHYHFLFFALTGLLEKAGLRIDIALNLLSILGFTALLYTIYYIGKNWFHSKAIGILSIIFLVCNGSLSFLSFFGKHPLSVHTITDIYTNTQFPSFAPYGPGIVSAFWNLNIYTNQRHLAPSYALSLFIIYILLKPIFKSNKKTTSPSATSSWKYYISPILIGLLFGLSFFFHMAVFLMTGIVIAILSILFPEIRLACSTSLIIAAIVAIPQYLYLKTGTGLGIQFAPGYLIKDTLTPLNFLNYWFMNLGLHSILMLIGFFTAPKKLKKIFIAFFSIFLIGNLFQFAVEMAANHKFFNYFMIIAAMFSAYVIVNLWNKNNYTKPFVVIITFLLILSGVIDFFPIYNDTYITLNDYPQNATVNWIKQHTKPESAIFNTSYLYDPASLAGRKIFLGWPYFPWSSGYDTTARSNEIKTILTSTSKKQICQFLIKNNLEYTELTGSTPDFPYNPVLWQQNFTTVYMDKTTGSTIYSTKTNCE